MAFGNFYLRGKTMGSKANGWCKKLMTKAKAQGIAQSKGTCKRHSNTRVALKGEIEQDNTFKFPVMLYAPSPHKVGETRHQRTMRLRAMRMGG